MKRTLLLLCLCFSGAAGAAIETYEFGTDDLRLRYQELSEELRCPKCQNQNIADSNAPIAQDLRKQLHQQLHAGKSDNEIADFMVQRYGEFVLYRPRWSASTALLWLAPVLLLGLGLWLLFVTIRKKDADDSAASTLTEAERDRVKQLLRDGTGND